MTEAAVRIVGGGRISRILLGGWMRAHGSLPGLVISDNNPESLNRLKAEFPAIVVTQDNREAARQPVVLFALHPPAFAGVLAEIKESLPHDGVLLSLAPVWTMSRICGALGGFNKLARVIPQRPVDRRPGVQPRELL